MKLNIAPTYFDSKILYKSYFKRGHADNTIKIARQRRWLPISTKSKRFLTILDIFAWIYGDGHLHKDGFVLLSGQREDLEKIAKRLKSDLKLDYRIVWDPWKGKIKTNTSKDTCRLYLKNGCRPFGRLLMAFEAPIGNKVYSKISIPQWIMKSDRKIKRRFLETFFSNELGVKNMERKNYAPKFEIRMNKSKDKIESGIFFMNQIKELLKEFGIKSLEPRLINRPGKNSTLGIIVASDLINIYKFYKIFNLRYSFRKQKNLENIGKEVEKKLRNYLQYIENYKEAMKLRKKGFGRRRASKLLNLNTYLIDSWYRRNYKPLYFERKNELKNLLGV